MSSRFRRALPTLSRLGFLLILCPLLVAGIAVAVSSSQGTMSTAEAIVTVPAGEGEGLPGNAQQAVTLAGTYTVVIPADGAVLATVGQEIGRSVDEVEESLTAVNDEGTAVIRLRFQDSDEITAVRGAQAAATAVTGRTPETSSVGRNVLQRVRAARVVSVVGTASSAAAPIGAVLGLFLGVALLIAWQRVDPRIDHPEALADEIGIPTSTLRDLNEARVAVLIERWQSLANRGAAPLRITLLPGTDGAQELARLAAERLVAFSPIATMSSSDRLGDEGGQGLVRFVVGGVPGTEAASEGLAADGDLTVLVVKTGTRLATLKPGLTALSQFGVSPDWGLVGSQRDLG